MIFVNLTNHPSCFWKEEQRKAAGRYGEIVDLPFPNVPPDIKTGEIAETARQLVDRLVQMNPSAVLCQGEYTLTHSVVTRLQKKGIPCLAGISERLVRETTDESGNTVKESIFVFCGFREYETVKEF